MRFLCLTCLILLKSITDANYYSYYYEGPIESVSFDYDKSLGDLGLQLEEQKVTTTSKPNLTNKQKVVKKVRLKKMPLFTVDHIVIGEENVTSPADKAERYDNETDKIYRLKTDNVQPYIRPKLYVSPFSLFTDPLWFKINVPQFDEVKELLVYTRTWHYNFWLNMIGIPGNMCYSPVGVVAALAILHLSLSARSSAAMEIRQSLDLEKKEWWDVVTLLAFYIRFMKQKELYMMNKVFVDYRFTRYPMFEKFAKSLYFVKTHTFVQNHYLQNIKEFNAMIKNETHGAFPEILSYGDIEGHTSIFFLQLMEFNSAWEQPFSPKDVRWENFYTPNKFTFEGDVMYMERPVQCDYISELDIKALLLPFKGGRHVMIFATTNNIDKFKDTERKIDFFEVYDYLSQIEPYVVRIGIPKFDITYEIPSRDFLYFTGVQIALTQEANYRHICNNSKRIFHHTMIQKITFRITENGTYPLDKDAKIPPTVTKNSTPEFIIRHSFMVAIMDTQTKSLLITARIYNAGMLKLNSELFKDEKARLSLREKHSIVKEYAYNKFLSLYRQYKRRRIRRRKRRRRYKSWRMMLLTGPGT